MKQQTPYYLSLSEIKYPCFGATHVTELMTEQDLVKVSFINIVLKAQPGRPPRSVAGWVMKTYRSSILLDLEKSRTSDCS